METYIASTEFKVGIDSEESVPIREKQIIKFDGINAEINGNEYNVPNLDAAIKSGWLVPKSDYEGRDVRPSSAGVEVSPADNEGEKKTFDGNVEVADEERVVNEVDNHEELVEQADESYDNPKTAHPSETSGDATQKSSTQSSQSGGEVQGQGEGQVVAGGFQTSTESNTSLGGRNGTNQSINRQIKETRSAVTRKDKVDAPATENDPVREKTSTPDAGAEPINDGNDFPQATSQKSAVPENTRTAPSEEDNRQQEIDVEEDDELDPETKEGRYKTLQAANPDLPDFDFDEHWATRMKTLREDHSDDHEMIRAVYAAESGKIKGRIKEEFSEAFDDE
jgi:hypothetical protein